MGGESKKKRKGREKQVKGMEANSRYLPVAEVAVARLGNCAREAKHVASAQRHVERKIKHVDVLS